MFHFQLKPLLWWTQNITLCKHCLDIYNSWWRVYLHTLILVHITWIQFFHYPVLHIKLLNLLDSIFAIHESKVFLEMVKMRPNAHFQIKSALLFYMIEKPLWIHRWQHWHLYFNKLFRIGHQMEANSHSLHVYQTGMTDHASHIRRWFIWPFILKGLGGGGSGSPYTS